MNEVFEQQEEEVIPNSDEPQLEVNHEEEPIIEKKLDTPFDSNEEVIKYGQ